MGLVHCVNLLIINQTLSLLCRDINYGQPRVLALRYKRLVIIKLLELAQNTLDLLIRLMQVKDGLKVQYLDRYLMVDCFIKRRNIFVIVDANQSG